MRLSYLYNGNLSAGKMASLYWDGPQISWLLMQMDYSQERCNANVSVALTTYIDNVRRYFDGLVQERRNSSVLAME